MIKIYLSGANIITIDSNAPMTGEQERKNLSNFYL